jgi:hypothetical protein
MAVLGGVAVFFNYQFFMQTVLANLFLVKKSLSSLQSQDTKEVISDLSPTRKKTMTAIERRLADKEK